MPNTEALMPDGSLTTSYGDGGFSIDGPLAMYRYQVVSVISGLEWNLKTGGHIRRNYTQDCLAFMTHLMEQQDFVSQGLPAWNPYPRSRKGKERALEDAKWALASLNSMAVVIETES